MQNIRIHSISLFFLEKKNSLTCICWQLDIADSKYLKKVHPRENYNESVLDSGKLEISE